MDMDKIKREILKAIENKSGKKVTTKSVLKDIGMDSLDMLDQVVEFEAKYNIKINDEDLFEIKSVQDIVNTVEKYVKK